MQPGSKNHQNLKVLMAYFDDYSILKKETYKLCDVSNRDYCPIQYNYRGCILKFNLVCNQNLNILQLFGVIAQLGERLPCKQEVSGSIPLSSTNIKIGNQRNLVTYFISYV